jgi:hypothetical protein
VSIKKIALAAGAAALILSAAAGIFYWKSVVSRKIPSVTSTEVDKPVRTREFPASLAELPQVSHVEGEQAFAELERLHGRRVPLVNAYIVRYQRLDRYVKLWISVSSTETEATDLEARMTAVLPRTGMYTAAQPFTVGDETLYGTIDTHVNTVNYYFASGPEVVWLETNLTAEEISAYLPSVVEKY